MHVLGHACLTRSGGMATAIVVRSSPIGAGDAGPAAVTLLNQPPTAHSWRISHQACASHACLAEVMIWAQQQTVQPYRRLRCGPGSGDSAGQATYQAQKVHMGTCICWSRLPGGVGLVGSSTRRFTHIGAGDAGPAAVILPGRPPTNHSKLIGHHACARPRLPDQVWRHGHSNRRSFQPYRRRRCGPGSSDSAEPASYRPQLANKSPGMC